MSKKPHGLIVTLLIILTFLLAFPNTVFADGGEGGSEKEVNGYHVRLIFSGPVKSGENQFHIQITDALGMPVTSAEVKISAMPIEGMDEMTMATEVPSVGVMTSNNNMGGMGLATESPSTGVMKPNKPAVSEDALIVMLNPAAEPGEYGGNVHFAASGEWMFNVQFTINGETSTVEFPFEVGRTLGVNYAVLAGFFGINATVIAIAAVLKKRQAAVIRK